METLKKINLKITFFLLVSTFFIPSQSLKAQKIEAEGAINWVESFGAYTGTWGDRTAAGATGRRAGSTGSWRARYMMFANLGVAAGTYDVDLRWYDENTENLSEMVFQLGQRTCNGPKTDVCTTGVLSINDRWFANADTSVATFATRTYKNVVLSATDTLFMFTKLNSSSNAAWFDYVVFRLPGSNGIKDIDINTGVHVYPNPFNSTATISFEKEVQNASIKVMDLIGQEVRALNFSDSQLVLEKGNLHPGIYFIHVVSGSKIIALRKVVVE